MFSLPVTMPMENFRYVMGRSSAIREMMVEVLMVTWDNLGGLENLKETCRSWSSTWRSFSSLALCPATATSSTALTAASRCCSSRPVAGNPKTLPILPKYLPLHLLSIKRRGKKEANDNFSCYQFNIQTVYFIINI